MKKIAFLLMLLTVLEIAQAMRFGKNLRGATKKNKSKREKPPKKRSRKNVKTNKNSNGIKGGVHRSSVNMSNKGKKNVHSNHKSKNHGY